ncbi:MAG: recombination endonuclease subunit [uncultured marine phage]|uniref:Recombination endonuclease subunit n=1 Tax=uncultured marine phage TaxID=707152 RepID=A0A8D9FRD1_9VIRU|nr:MAG: recombination endonuclease subunit [uncultured marine phage]
MRIWTLGDLHFGQYPLDVKWLKMMIRYFDDFFIPLLKEKYQEGDVFVQLGDIFHNRNSVDIKVMNVVDRIFRDISEIIPTHVLVGNHDIYNRSSNDINSTMILRRHENVFIYENTESIEIEGVKIVMMPWVERKVDQIELLKKHSPADFLFCHSDLNGCKMHLNSVAHKNLNKIDIEEFTEYGKVVSGHIHIRQENKNFLFTGSAYQLDRNDIGNEKGIHIFEPNGEFEFIPNTISPTFKKVKIMNEDDVDNLDISTSRNYVDLAISNSLLVSNRKLRRKLEQILEEGNFARVEYVNDMVSDTKELEEKLEKELEEINIDEIDFDDFDEIILSYINSSEWSSEEIKDGVLKEFSNIIDIYKQQYKING